MSSKLSKHTGKLSSDQCDHSPRRAGSPNVDARLLGAIDRMDEASVRGWPDALIADDVAGDVKLVIAKNPSGRISAAWLASVTKHIAISQLRKRIAERKHLARWEAGRDRKGSEPMVEDREAVELIRQAINRLPNAQRAAIARVISDEDIELAIDPPVRPTRASGHRKALHDARRALTVLLAAAAQHLSGTSRALNARSIDSAK